MKKRLVIIAAVVVLLLMASFLLLKNDESKQQQTTSPPQTTSSQNSTDPAPSQQNVGSYEEYSQEKLARTTGTKILFFHASWCPQCRALEADIQKNGVPADVTIFKVDYDNAQDLRKKYGVTLQTTVVKVDENGNLISKFTPYQKPTLDNALSNL